MSTRHYGENRLPDWSFAGYMKGGVALPDKIPIKKLLTPQPGDDAIRIQEITSNIPKGGRG